MIALAAVVPFLALAASAPSSPSSPLDRLPQNAAGAAVRRAIDHAGGWKAWEAKKTAELKITSRHARPDGSGMETRTEIHHYRLGPVFGVRIEVDDRGKKVLMVNNGRFATKVADAREDFSVTAGREAREETFAAHYLFGVPFKLTDKGARLESLGQGTLEDGTTAERVRVTYEPGAGDSGAQHTWTYFFDSKSGALRAARVDMSPDKTYYFEFLDEKAFDGMRLPTRIRQSAMEASGKRGALISESSIDELRFDVPMDDALFAIPPR
jgi:hypothetical protein